MVTPGVACRWVGGGRSRNFPRGVHGLSSKGPPKHYLSERTTSWRVACQENCFFLIFSRLFSFPLLFRLSFQLFYSFCQARGDGFRTPGFIPGMIDNGKRGIHEALKFRLNLPVKRRNDSLQLPTINESEFHRKGTVAASPPSHGLALSFDPSFFPSSSSFP